MYRVMARQAHMNTAHQGRDRRRFTTFNRTTPPSTLGRVRWRESYKAYLVLSIAASCVRQPSQNNLPGRATHSMPNQLAVRAW